MISKKPSILLSIFRRKGGEGNHTFVINEGVNKLNYELLTKLRDNEICLIAYYKDRLHWCMITDSRLMAYMGECKINLMYSEIKEVNPAMEEEYKAGIMDKLSFTRLKIRDHKNSTSILELEAGKPYWGLFQVLHRIAADDSASVF